MVLISDTKRNFSVKRYGSSSVIVGKTVINTANKTLEIPEVQFDDLENFDYILLKLVYLNERVSWTNQALNFEDASLVRLYMRKKMFQSGEFKIGRPGGDGLGTLLEVDQGTAIKNVVSRSGGVAYIPIAQILKSGILFVKRFQDAKMNLTREVNDYFGTGYED